MRRFVRRRMRRRRFFEVLNTRGLDGSSTALLLDGVLSIAAGAPKDVCSSDSHRILLNVVYGRCPNEDDVDTIPS